MFYLSIPSSFTIIFYYYHHVNPFPFSRSSRLFCELLASLVTLPFLTTHHEACFRNAQRFTLPSFRTL